MVALSPAAQAFGIVGHRVAGLVAQANLCAAAAAAVAEVDADQGLAELGLWADRIRDRAAYAHTGPWHYLNIADGASLSDYAGVAEGDVVWAIEHFRAALTGARGGEQREALRFLVHFVVDVHQPLHVGRAEDRGGNTIVVRWRGERTNLHRFWDSDAIELDELSVRARGARLLDLIGANNWTAGEIDAASWARESMDLRPAVYDFDHESGRLDRRYLERARRVSEQRLALAGLRLAATLNSIYCP